MSVQAAAWIEALARPVDNAVLVYFGVLNLCYFTLLVAAVVEMRRTRNEAVGISDHIVVGSRLAPTISILAPAYNEEATIAASVQSLLTLDYPNLEVVVIADGCKDDTIGVLQREFDAGRGPSRLRSAGADQGRGRALSLAAARQPGRRRQAQRRQGRRAQRRAEPRHAASWCAPSTPTP